MKGTLPSELSQLKQLSVLDLDDNSLSGTLPPTLSHFAELKRLEIHANSLSGTLPFTSVTSSKLAMVDLDDNRLTGSLPSQLGVLSQLQVLRLAQNNLTGVLPTHLAALQIRDLALDWKEFDGGRKPPWVRRNRGHSGRLKKFATLGKPYDSGMTLPDDSDEAMFSEAIKFQREQYTALHGDEL